MLVSEVTDDKGDELIDENDKGDALPFVPWLATPEPPSPLWLMPLFVPSVAKLAPAS